MSSTSLPCSVSAHLCHCTPYQPGRCAEAGLSMELRWHVQPYHLLRLPSRPSSTLHYRDCRTHLLLGILLGFNRWNLLGGYAVIIQRACSWVRSCGCSRVSGPLLSRRAVWLLIAQCTVTCGTSMHARSSMARTGTGTVRLSSTGSCPSCTETTAEQCVERGAEILLSFVKES